MDGLELDYSEIHRNKFAVEIFFNVFRLSDLKNRFRENCGQKTWKFGTRCLRTRRTNIRRLHRMCVCVSVKKRQSVKFRT